MSSVRIVEVSLRSSARAATVYAVLADGPHAQRSRIVAVRPDRRVDYVVPSGVFHRYVARVDLEGEPRGGTHIRWRVAFLPRLRGTGRLLGLVTARHLRRAVCELARSAADREYDTPPYS